MTNTCGPFGTYGCGCVSTDPRLCAQIRYGVNPDPDCQRCECLCHDWRKDDDQLARVEKQAQTDWKIGAGLDCDDDSDYLGGVTCWSCGGSGTVLLRRPFETPVRPLVPKRTWALGPNADLSGRTRSA